MFNRRKIRAALVNRRMQIANVLLRMIPMAAKLCLTLYMGHAFQLADIGSYGLVVGATTILGVVIGQDLIYFVSRDICGAGPLEALLKMRDQAVLYGLNYLVVGVGIGAIVATHALDVAPRMLVFTLILTILESLGTISYYNLIFLNHQIRANALFAVRAGIWTLPVIALGLIDARFRTPDVVLMAWTAGSALSLVLALWLWRYLPWKALKTHPINWAWIWKGIKVGSPIWIGMMGLTGGAYMDRFVVEHYLTMDDVGVLTFYASFTNALLTLIGSGVSAFTTPVLIGHHRRGDDDAFAKEARSSSLQVAVGSAAISIGLAVAVPLIGFLIGRPEFVTTSGVFLLMLCGAWLRANADMKNNILFARHQDRAIWLGNLLFLIPALGGNFMLVPWIGFAGVGYSAVVASAFLLAWRWIADRRYVREQHPEPFNSDANFSTIDDGV